MFGGEEEVREEGEAGEGGTEVAFCVHERRRRRDEFVRKWEEREKEGEGTGADLGSRRDRSLEARELDS